MEGEEIEIVFDEERQAPAARPYDARILAAPEIPVMDEHRVGACRDGGFEKLHRCGDAAHDARDLVATFHLQAVWAIILEPADVEITVEVGGQLASLHRFRMP